jgi:hypothetical protein
MNLNIAKKFTTGGLILSIFLILLTSCSNLKENVAPNGVSKPQTRAFENVFNLDLNGNPAVYLANLRQYVRDNFTTQRQAGASDQLYTGLLQWGPNGCLERPGTPNYFIVTVTFSGLTNPFAFVVGTADLYIQGYIPVYNRSNTTQNVYYYYRDNRPNPNAPRIRAVTEANRAFELDLGVEYAVERNTLINIGAVTNAITAIQNAAFAADGRAINLPGGLDTNNIFGVVFAETTRLNPVYQQIQAALQPNNPGTTFAPLHKTYLTQWGRESNTLYTLEATPALTPAQSFQLAQLVFVVIYIAKYPDL